MKEERDDYREYTKEEVREKFLAHIIGMVGIWENAGTAQTVREKLSGLAFSILVLLDGGAGDMPCFIVAPDPHPDDREFNRMRGENWFPENDAEKVKCDISGGLHEMWCAMERMERKRGW